MDKSLNSDLVKKINSANFHAMFFSRKIGRILAEEHPEILDRYRNGETMIELAQIYINDFDISHDVGMNSIYYCLREFAEKGVVSLEELKLIGREHTIKGSQAAGKITGKKAYENGTACFGISEARRSEISREVAYKMGKKYGKKNYAKTFGAMTEEEKRKAHRRSNRTQGYVPYDEFRLELYCGFMNEIEFITYLRERKKLEWKDVAREANRYFENGRGFVAIRTNYNSNWRGKCS